MTPKTRTNQLTLIFKPTYQCNLHCDYCYAEMQRDSNRSTMTREEAQYAFAWLLEYCKDHDVSMLSVVWHGGEPLLPGIEFIEQVIGDYTSLFEQHGITCKNSLQTNLTMITRAHLPLLKRYFGDAVGFSFDYQTNARRYRNGKDAMPEVLRNALWLKDEGIDVGAISMLTSRNISRIPEIYDFFKKHRIPFKLNQVFPTESLSSPVRECANAVTGEQFAEAICRLFDIWFADPDPHMVDTISDFLLAYLRNGSGLCCFEENCLDHFICLGPNGDIYPCGRFDSEKYKMGNYYTDSPKQLKDCRCELNCVALTIKEYAHTTAGEYPNCTSCEYLAMCNGGCPHAMITGWQVEECRTSKKIWRHMESVLAPMGLTRGIFAELTESETKEILGRDDW